MSTGERGIRRREYNLTPPPRFRIHVAKECDGETLVGSDGKDLRKYVRDVVLRGNEGEEDDTVAFLGAQPRHLNAEVAIAARDDVVINHRHTRLVILVEDGRRRLRKAKFGEQVAKPNDVLGALCGGDVLRLSSAETDGLGRFGLPTDQAVGEVDGVAITRAALGLVTEGGVGVSRDNNRPDSAVVTQGQVGGGVKITQDTNGGTPVRHGRRLRVLACTANDGGDVRTGNGGPEQAAYQRQVRETFFVEQG